MRGIVAILIVGASLLSAGNCLAFQPEFRSAGDWSMYCHDTSDGPDCTITNPQGKIGEVAAGGQIFSMKVRIWKGANDQPMATVCTASSGKEEAVILASAGAKVRSSESKEPGFLCFEGDSFKPAFMALYNSGFSVGLSFLGSDGHYREAQLHADGLPTLMDDAFEILGIPN